MDRGDMEDDARRLAVDLLRPAGAESMLAAALKNSGSRLRLKIVSNADNAKALTEFDRRRIREAEE